MTSSAHANMAMMNIVESAEAEAEEELMNEEILDEGDMLPRGHGRIK